MIPHDDRRELRQIKNADNQKVDVMIQQEEMKSMMSNGTHNVHNQRYWIMSQYNAQRQESNQVSLNINQYNVRRQD